MLSNTLQAELQAMEEEIRMLKSQPLPDDFFEAEDKKHIIINLRFRMLAMLRNQNTSKIN